MKWLSLGTLGLTDSSVQWGPRERMGVDRWYQRGQDNRTGLTWAGDSPTSPTLKAVLSRAQEGPGGAMLGSWTPFTANSRGS